MQKETPSNRKEVWYQALLIDPTSRQPVRTQIKHWAQEQWTKEWEKQKEKVPPDKRPTAYNAWPQLNIHHNLTKAESSLAIQLRIEKTGLNTFLASHKVPGIAASCLCRHPRQTIKYIILFCLEYYNCITFLSLANTLDLHYILSNKDILYKALHWFLQQGLLLQFQLALPVLTILGRTSLYK